MMLSLSLIAAFTVDQLEAVSDGTLRQTRTRPQWLRRMADLWLQGGQGPSVVKSLIVG
jgi:hypothetical protein